MSNNGKLVVSTIAGAIVSGIYWFAYSWVAYGLTAGDYRPGSEPSEAYLDAKAILAVLAGPILYAIGAWYWRRAEQRFAPTDRR